MSLIDGLLAMLSGMESDAIAVHDERCIAVRNRNASCLRCVEACTSGAIAYRDNELTVEPERCIGCGTCATACPTSAIEIRTPSDDELTSLVKRSIVATKGHPVVACETALAACGACDGAQVAAVPCLGRVDESVLVGMAAYKAFDVTLVCGDCETCAHATGGRLAREVAQSARNLLAAFGSEFAVRMTDELPQGARVAAGGAGAPVQGVSRRAFLRAAKDESARAASAAVQHEVAARLGEPEKPVATAFRKVGEDGTLSQFVPSRRVRLYNYLNHVGEPVAQEVDSRVIGAVSIDADRCTSCRMCAVFCPTGAIQKLDDGDLFGIVHRPSACMQCRLCESICAHDAITVASRIPVRQFMGKEAVCYAMEKPTWTPNKPASMYNKVHEALGKDLEMCMF